MLLTNPPVVRFGTRVWEDVETLAVDRQADRTVIEHDDFGPHAVFADVPEQSMRLKIQRRIGRDDIDSPVPGERDEIVFYTSPAGADAARKRLTATAVVLSVKHELAPGQARQTITLAAVSAAGDADPLSIEDAA